MAVDLERHQAERIEGLKARVEISPTELAQIVREVSSDSAFIAFPLLLALPVFKDKLNGPGYTSSLDLLRLFAYGTWENYKSNSESFPGLSDTQMWKLKQLTVLALARSNKKLTYDRLRTLLDFSDVGSLEDFLQSCNNVGIVRGNLNKQQDCFEVLYTVDALQRSHGKVKGESFDAFLETAKKDSKGATNDLLCNGVVRQVPLPRDGKNCCMAEFQPRANSLFVMLLWHVTSAHSMGRSFDGQIYPGMFDVVGDQLLLPPYAAAQKQLTPKRFDKDRKAVAVILRNNTGLNISHTGRDGVKKQILYPVYMENLLDHLEGNISNLQQVHSTYPLSMARDKNYIIFILCHPTFLKHAVRSVLFWYVRIYHKASSTTDQAKFKSAMNNIKIKHDWYKAIQNHWLFKKVFNSATYNNTNTDCFRFIRDWEIHVPGHLSETQKVQYTAAVINYLAAHHFGDFLPDALYQLLCTYSKEDSKFDLKVWIERLQQLPEEDTSILTMEWDQLVLHGLPTNNVSNRQTDKIVLQLEKLRQNVDGTSNHSPLNKWRTLNILRGKNETMYYKILIDNIEEYASIVYKPTIKNVCQNSSGIIRSPWGMYLSAKDQGHMMSILHSSPVNEVDLIVVTDGSSVLGFDLGTKGMGIAVGKSDLYVATAGINPHKVLPFMIDVGTNNEKLLEDPLYYGMQRHRLEGQDFCVVIDELMSAVFTRWPKVIVQFESFQTKWAFKLLEQYKTMYRIFNDEIQGTIGVLIAGLLRAVEAQGKPLSDFAQQRIVVAGVDSAGVAILEAVARVFGNCESSFGSVESARSQYWIIDEHGLLTDDRANVDADKRPFARKTSELPQDLCEGSLISDVVKIVEPDIFLILSAGVSPVEVLQSIKDFSSSLRPVIFDLSNSQFTAENVFVTLGEHVMFASSVQFANMDHGNGKIGYSNFVNSIYLYPGIALGTHLSGARLISDDMLYAAAKCLASLVKDKDAIKGMLYPPVSSIRDITKNVAAAVMMEAIRKDLAQGHRAIDVFELANLGEEEVLRHVETHMWAPT